MTRWLTERSPVLLAIFCIALVALNVWRLDEWGSEGFRDWLSNTIMQTTLFDFAWVLFVMVAFVHDDAKQHGLTYWWIVPTFPFMPTIGLLLYFVVRRRHLRRVALPG